MKNYEILKRKEGTKEIVKLVPTLYAQTNVKNANIKNSDIIKINLFLKEFFIYIILYSYLTN